MIDEAEDSHPYHNGLEIIFFESRTTRRLRAWTLPAAPHPNERSRRTRPSCSRRGGAAARGAACVRA